MKYVKPEVASAGLAVAAIQQNPPNSKMGGPSDHSAQVTANAYEADE